MASRPFKSLSLQLENSSLQIRNDHPPHGIQDCPGNECPYYPTLVRMLPSRGGKLKEIWNQDSWDSPTPSDYSEIFHRHCDQCVAAEDAENMLCAFCRHLRLRHLFVCLRRQQPDRYPLISLGSLSCLKHRTTCSFCDMVVKIFFKQFQASSECPVLVYNYTGGDPERIQCEFPGDIGPPELVLFQRCSLGFNLADSHFARVRNLFREATEYPENLTRPDMFSGERVDWHKVNLWLKECDNKHEHSSGNQGTPISALPAEMRLANVRQQCLVRAPPFPRFAALSYVWGDPESDEIHAKKSNQDTLSIPGGLRLGSLPKTISDAMIVCMELDIPYLWVDRFCILQDDEDHKHAQILAMDAIYSNSSITICAAVVQTSKPFSRPRSRTAGMEILPILPGLSDSLMDRPWHQRGWTFQEHKLSNRLLLFTDWQLFFKCYVET